MSGSRAATGAEVAVAAIFGRAAPAAAVFGVAGVVIAIVTLGTAGTTVIRWEAVGAVLALGALARRAVWLDGFATADFYLRSGELPGWDRERRRSAARGRLAGGLAGLAVIGVVSGGWLAVNGLPVDHVAAVLVGLCLIIRSRLFRPVATAWSLVAAGAVVVVYGALNTLVDPPALADALVPLAVALVVGSASSLAFRSGPDGSTVAQRLLNWAESTAVTAMACTAVAATDPSGFLAALASTY